MGGYISAMLGRAVLRLESPHSTGSGLRGPGARTLETVTQVVIHRIGGCFALQRASCQACQIPSFVDQDAARPTERKEPRHGYDGSDQTPLIGQTDIAFAQRRVAFQNEKVAVTH